MGGAGKRRLNRVRGAVAALAAAVTLSSPAAADPPKSPRLVTVGRVCDLIEAEAKTHGLPREFLARLIWKESRFDPNAVSPAGAEGIAQFMPGTAAQRGLGDPYDIDQAIRAQERASEAVAVSMGQAVEASAQTAERARATRAAADQVHALGGQLHAEVGRFVL